MSSIDVTPLTFSAHTVDPDGIEIFDVAEESDDQEKQVYSCVALYRGKWRDDWPALGGTRWFQPVGDEVGSPELARSEAASLALAMFMKHNLIRKAELELEHRAQLLSDGRAARA